MHIEYHVYIYIYMCVYIYIYICIYSFLNLQTDVHFPESDGIVQVEEFGMHVSVDGILLYYTI